MVADDSTLARLTEEARASILEAVVSLAKKPKPATAPDPEFEKVVKALANAPGVTYGGKGFGSSALKVNGKIFAMSSSKREFVVKLSKGRVAELAAAGAGSYFEPGRGRQMREWLAVSAGPKRWLALAREALAFGREAAK
jgi:hypothetical protein